MDRPEPQTFGPFQILGTIGRGSTATVYRARQGSLGRIVALKVLDPFHAGDGQETERFRREARLAASLNHPNILKVFDCGVTEGQLWISTEFIEGGTLRQDQRIPYPPERALRYSRQILGALRVMHQAGIIHRDIKSSNVLLTNVGECILADFGLARAVDSKTILTMAGSFMGTLLYAAPELVTGIPATFAADQYSFGTLVHELFSGDVPFRGQNPQAVVARILAEPPPPLPPLGVPWQDEIQAILDRILKKHPEERYESLDALAPELDRVGKSPRGQPTPRPLARTAPVTGSPPETPRGLKRPATVPFSGAAGAAGVAGVPAGAPAPGPAPHRPLLLAALAGGLLLCGALVLASRTRPPGPGSTRIPPPATPSPSRLAPAASRVRPGREIFEGGSVDLIDPSIQALSGPLQPGSDPWLGPVIKLDPALREPIARHLGLRAKSYPASVTFVPPEPLLPEELRNLMARSDRGEVPLLPRENRPVVGTSTRVVLHLHPDTSYTVLCRGKPYAIRTPPAVLVSDYVKMGPRSLVFQLFTLGLDLSARVIEEEKNGSRLLAQVPGDAASADFCLRGQVSGLDPRGKLRFEVIPRGDSGYFFFHVFRRPLPAPIAYEKAYRNTALEPFRGFLAGQRDLGVVVSGGIAAIDTRGQEATLGYQIGSAFREFPDSRSIAPAEDLLQGRADIRKLEPSQLRDLQRGVCLSMGYIGSQPALPWLVKHLDQSLPPEEALAYIEALARYGDSRVTTFLDTYLDHVELDPFFLARWGRLWVWADPEGFLESSRRAVERAGTISPARRRLLIAGALFLATPGIIPTLGLADLESDPAELVAEAAALLRVMDTGPARKLLERWARRRR